MRNTKIKIGDKFHFVRKPTQKDYGEYLYSLGLMAFDREVVLGTEYIVKSIHKGTDGIQFISFRNGTALGSYNYPVSCTSLIYETPIMPWL